MKRRCRIISAAPNIRKHYTFLLSPLLHFARQLSRSGQTSSFLHNNILYISNQLLFPLKLPLKISFLNLFVLVSVNKNSLYRQKPIIGFTIRRGYNLHYTFDTNLIYAVLNKVLLRHCFSPTLIVQHKRHI